MSVLKVARWLFQTPIRKLSSAAWRQDMPPTGGYGNIVYERVPLKKGWSGYKLFTVWALTTTVSFYIYIRNHEYVRVCKRENADVTVALEPLLIAERDRMYLNQLRKNRDEERELMKDVPGWVVGTYYGEPLYKTIGEDKLMHPIPEEYFAHAKPLSMYYSLYYECWW